MSEVNRMDPRVIENSEEFGKAPSITEITPQIAEVFDEVKRRVALAEERKEGESDTFHQHPDIGQGLGDTTLTRRSFLGAGLAGLAFFSGTLGNQNSAKGEFMELNGRDNYLRLPVTDSSNPLCGLTTIDLEAMRISYDKETYAILRKMMWFNGQPLAHDGSFEYTGWAGGNVPQKMALTMSSGSLRLVPQRTPVYVRTPLSKEGKPMRPTKFNAEGKMIYQQPYPSIYGYATEFRHIEDQCVEGKIYRINGKPILEVHYFNYYKPVAEYYRMGARGVEYEGLNLLDQSLRHSIMKGKFAPLIPFNAYDCHAPTAVEYPRYCNFNFVTVPHLVQAEAEVGRSNALSGIPVGMRVYSVAKERYEKGLAIYNAKQVESKELSPTSE